MKQILAISILLCSLLLTACNNASIGVIGGADGPTSIIVSEKNIGKTLSYTIEEYFRDNYEKALENLPLVTSDININKIEVWVTNTTSNYENSRNIVAFTDLGEGKEEWIYNDNNIRPAGIIGAQYPDDTVNTLLYDMDYNSLRSLNSVTSYLTSQGYTSGKDFEKLQKARKLNPSEYVLNSKLGFITLNINCSSFFGPVGAAIV